MLSNPFTITIVDPCAHAFATAPTIDPIVYTIGSQAYTAMVPMWTYEPASCAPIWEIIMVCDDGGLGNAFNYNGVELEVRETSNIALARDTPYEAKLCVDFNGSTSETTVLVTIKDPCLDSDYITVTTSQVPPFHYILYTASQNTWNIPLYTVNGDWSITYLCGSLKCEVEAGNLTPAINYNQWTGQFRIYSQDMSLLETNDGLYEYKLTCWLENYPECKDTLTHCGGYTSAVINLHSPCIEPFELEAIMVDSVSMDGVEPATLVHPGIIVTPVVCEDDAVHDCIYVSGPYTGPLDLCDVDEQDGDTITNGTFDPETGDFNFFSNDFDQFPPGDYNFELSVTVGDITTT